jgi:hypothetical protein
MAIPGFFKQNKPRGFNYVPRYYDPVKEEMEERRRAHKEQSDVVPPKREGTGLGAQGTEQGAQSGVYRSKIMRGDMKNYFHRRKERVEKHTLIRVIVIALVMIMAIYFYLRF